MAHRSWQDDHAQGGLDDLPSYEEAIRMRMEVANRVPMPHNKSAEESNLEHQTWRGKRHFNDNLPEPSAPPEYEELLDSSMPPSAPLIESVSSGSAIGFGATAAAIYRPPLPPALSAVDAYRDSKLYLLLKRLKNTIDSTTEEINRMESSEALGLEIKTLGDTSFRAMQALAKEPPVVMDIGDNTGNQESWFITTVRERRKGNTTVDYDEDGRSRKNYEKLEGQNHKDLEYLKLWMNGQQRQDSEWTDMKSHRIPTLSEKEHLDMKNIMMKMLNRRLDMANLRNTGMYTVSVDVADYATAVLCINSRNRTRSSRPKKRKFGGNRFTTVEDKGVENGDNVESFIDNDDNITGF